MSPTSTKRVHLNISWAHIAGRDIRILTDTGEPIRQLTLDPSRDHQPQAKGISVQSHGHHHIDLAHAWFDEARDDLTTSIDLLRQILGNPPRFLAFPYSHGSPAAQAAAESLGFATAFKIKGRNEGPYARTRVCIMRLDPT